MKGTFRRLALVGAALGFTAPVAQTPQAAPNVRANTSPNKQSVPAQQAPTAAIIEVSHRRGFFGAHRRHPVWLGVGKRGGSRHGRNGRSRWNYQR